MSPSIRVLPSHSSLPSALAQAGAVEFLETCLATAKDELAILNQRQHDLCSTARPEFQLEGLAVGERALENIKKRRQDLARSLVRAAQKVAKMQVWLLHRLVSYELMLQTCSLLLP